MPISPDVPVVFIWSRAHSDAPSLSNSYAFLPCPDSQGVWSLQDSPLRDAHVGRITSPILGPFVGNLQNSTLEVAPFIAPIASRDFADAPHSPARDGDLLCLYVIFSSVSDTVILSPTSLRLRCDCIDRPVSNFGFRKLLIAPLEVMSLIASFFQSNRGVFLFRCTPACNSAFTCTFFPIFHSGAFDLSFCSSGNLSDIARLVIFPITHASQYFRYCPASNSATDRIIFLIPRQYFFNLCHHSPHKIETFTSSLSACKNVYFIAGCMKECLSFDGCPLERASFNS